MRVLMSGGGTAGHIYPALTVADRLRDDGHEVAYAGTSQGPEARLAREAGLVFHALPSRGFDRSRPLSMVTASLLILVSTLRASILVRRMRPDVVAGFGGYVSLPVGLAAILCRVPLVLHEQNSVPGMANRLLSRRAVAVGVTYSGSARRMRSGAVAVHTGNPVRRSVLDAERASARALLGLPADGRVLLVFGGSGGARHVNEALVALAPELLVRDDLHVLHVAGRTEAEAVRHRLAALGLDVDAAQRYRVFDYLEEMGAALAAADVVVARAGATTIAEVTAVGRAAVLIPYPYATEDHQSLNAHDVEGGGGAVVVADSDLDEGALAPALATLLDDASARARMAAASASLGVRDADERLCELIVGAATGRPIREGVAA